MQVFPIQQTPLIIPGCRLWLDATTTTAGTIASWADKSGFKSNQAQATGGNQPTSVANIINGKPIVRFDGTSSFMTGTIASMTNLTVCMVAISQITPLPTDSVQAFLATGRSAGGGWAIDATQYGSGVRRISGDADYTMQFYINGVAGTAGTDPGSVGNLTLGVPAITIGTFATGTAKTTLYLGEYADGSFKGQNDLAEIIIYNRVLSASELTQINRYLANKWGIAIS